MEFVYLWVEKYKNIKEQGFNFSGRYLCGYDHEKNKLTIEKNSDYIHVFPEKINITAIVGENGSGKSNILNLIFSEHITTNVFFILKIHTELKVYGIDLYNTDYPNNTIQEEQLQAKVFQCTNLKSGKLDNHKLAFYSPLLQDSFTDNIDNHKNKFNLSPSSLLDDYKASQQIYSKRTFKNIYGIYESNAIQNSIDMIKNCKNLVLPFDIPTELTIRVNKIAEYEKYLQQYEFLKDKTPSENNFYGYVEQRAIKNWFSSSFEDFYRHDDELTKLILEKIKQNFGEIYLIDKLIEICPQEYQDSQGRFIGLNFLIEELKNIKKFLDAVKQLSKEVMDNSLKLPIQDIPDDFIIEYNKVVASCSAFLEFSWKPKLSSGQQVFLSQFSLFYKYLNNTEQTLILIDEGETTLHPNWQKMYVKYIINFFQNNIKTKKLHLIFSSHSPFILSDLPKENVIFLKDGKQDNTVNIDTFGANIHALLSHGFFMQDGLMGEFAKGKINQIINYLNDKESEIIDNETAQKFINIIGEPILKRQLQKMLDSKRISRMDEIDELKRRIELLESKQ